MSTIKIAKSASDPPRALRVVKAWWPGVSINNNPGSENFLLFSKSPQTL